MGSTKELVKTIQEFWSIWHEENVKKFATLLGNALEDKETAFIPLTSDTDNSPPIYVDSFQQ